jgi:hypothetical protein
MRTFVTISFLLTSFFYGCIPEQLSPKEYMSWVKNDEHGLCVTKQVGNCNFTLQYKPCEYEALLHQKNESVSKPELDKAIASINNLQYFMLTIKNSDGKEIMEEGSSDQVEYGSKLNYMISDMQLDFSLIDGRDTLPCAFYHYERNFGISPENNILLGFEIPKSKENKVNDKTIIGCVPSVT